MTTFRCARALFPLALILIGGGCASLPAPVLESQGLVRQAESITAPPEYATWWQEVRAGCERTASPCDTSLQFTDLRFYVAPPFMRGRALWAGGVWILVKAAYLHDRQAVEHEMLHAALNLTAEHGHPPVFRALGLDAGSVR